MDQPGRPPKRVRRDTRRCYECRRRKVKCQLTTEAVDVCSQCVKTGAACALDPTPNQVPSPERLRESAWTSVPSDNETRLESIENMLKKILEFQQQLVADRVRGQHHTMDQSSFLDRPFPTDEASLIGLTPLGTFSELAFGTQSSLPTISNSIGPSNFTKYSQAEEELISLIPSQQDAVLICTNTMAWVIDFPQPPGAIWRPKEVIPTRQPHMVVGSHILSVAQMLLFFALCLQQLPPEFDSANLDICDPEETVQSYIHAVTRVVLANDDLARSVQGLECLSLLGMIHINEFNIGKAWSVFRRAVDLSRLQEFHSSYSTPGQGDSLDHTTQRRLWLSAVMGDCYCSMLVGFETASGVNAFADIGLSDLAREDTINHRLCILSIQLTSSNLSDLETSLRASSMINQELDKLERSMPSSWWRAPKLDHSRSIETARDYERFTLHIWFFLLRLLTNLPFLNEAGSNTETGVFRELTLESARIILHRYEHVIRRAGNTQLHCRVLDISSFIATATLILAHSITPRCTVRQSSDMLLVEATADSLAEISQNCSREKVARQCSGVLRALLAAGDNAIEEESSPSLGTNGVQSNPLFPFIDGHDGARELLLRLCRKYLAKSQDAINFVNQALNQKNVEPTGPITESSLLDFLLNDDAIIPAPA